MRWNDSATSFAGAVQTFTMPVASSRVLVCASRGSANESSAAGEPATYSVP